MNIGFDGSFSGMELCFGIWKEFRDKERQGGLSKWGARGIMEFREAGFIFYGLSLHFSKNLS